MGRVVVCVVCLLAGFALSVPAAHYVRLRGGAELTGTLLQETSDRVVLDLGPRVVELPRGEIEELRDLTKDAAPVADAATSPTLRLPGGQSDGSGGVRFVLGPLTGRGALSRTQIIDAAMAGIVLVRNPSGSGSGFLIDLDGHIVTNYHVVRKEKYHEVTFFVKTGGTVERKKFENVELVALTPLYDLAVLKIDPAKAREQGVELRPLALAGSRDLEAGDPVLAVGNPGMGWQILEQTVSEGIVSAAARNFGDVLYIQTTAAVNPGNSGGPLLNSRGEVVGVVTLKAIFQEGIAFALPVRYLRDFLENQTAFAYDATQRNTGFRYLEPPQ